MALTSADVTAINNASATTGVPSGLLSAIAMQESGGNPFAVNSQSGAAGLFQVLPSTGANPGYGVQPLSNAYDPNASAGFAASYLQALYQKTGSWDAAIKQYSGGGYDLAALQTKYPDQFTGNQALTNTSANPSAVDENYQPIPGGTSGTSGSSSGYFASIVSSVWEVVQRSALILGGFALVMLALVALVFQSKTVQTGAANLAKARVVP